MEIIIQNAFNELNINGFKPIFNTTINEYVFRLSFDRWGKCFLPISNGHTKRHQRIYLDLNKTTNLNNLVTCTIKTVPHLKYQGGRIFLSKSNVYKKQRDLEIILG